MSMSSTASLLRLQQQHQQQPDSVPAQSPALPPQPSHIDHPQHPLPGHPPVMPESTPPETMPHPGLQGEDIQTSLGG